MGTPNSTLPYNRTSHHTCYSLWTAGLLLMLIILSANLTKTSMNVPPILARMELNVLMESTNILVNVLLVTLEPPVQRISMNVPPILARMELNALMELTSTLANVRLVSPEPPVQQTSMNVPPILARTEL